MLYSRQDRNSVWQDRSMLELGMSSLVSSMSRDVLYKKLNRLLGNYAQDLPNYKDPVKLSEDFKDFFTDKVTTIRDGIEKEKSITLTAAEEPSFATKTKDPTLDE